MTTSPEQKRNQWREHIQSWERSGQSQKAYCEANNLKPHQFWYWRRQFNEISLCTSQSTPPDEDLSNSFIPVRIENSPKPSNSLILEFPNGLRLHGLDHTSPERLKDIVRAVL